MGQVKVDLVITSNDMLALRDSNLSVADGGMRNLYEFFNISVANNCSQSVRNRTKAYNATVVYGQLANFQRDYLMDYFYHHNIRGDRTMDLVIIDEVDCMLLDRGNNTLYLSHDIPGMETLESVYVFIWEKVCTSSIETDVSILKESVKKAVLYDLYGAITKEDLKSIHAQLEDDPSETNALWNYLIEDKIIDAEGQLLMKNGIPNINYQENLNPKIAFYFRKVAERERHIRIPDHLMPFVDRHLNSWIDNAFHALELEIDKDYVVDQDRTDTSPDLNPQVIIIDPDTGTDQISTQWDEALHQFIQLKEGCKLTLQSLKTIFISNATYMKKYEKLAGVSGTLGTKTDRTFMERNYKCLYFVIPTAFEKRFHLKPPKVLKSKETWLKTIIKETEQTILTTDRHEARSVVIFCHSIKSVNLIHKSLKSSELINADNIHCYTSDFEKFAFESQSLEVGHVIVTTNLAGRGTNIKISEELRKNGGLHICLTFLPKNERIEEQAMGRSARNGAPGSGILILCDELAHSTSRGGQKWGAGKFESMNIERQWQESQRMSSFDDDARNIEHEETFFGDFSVDYISTTNELKYREHEDQEIKIICDSILDKWALWLDETVDQLDLSFSYYMEEFKDFISEFKLPDNKTANISWMTPVRSVAMAKYLATQKKKTNLSTAAALSSFLGVQRVYILGVK
jgi:preprotein translocase subunit SecA